MKIMRYHFCNWVKRDYEFQLLTDSLSIAFLASTLWWRKRSCWRGPPGQELRMVTGPLPRKKLGHQCNNFWKTKFYQLPHERAWKQSLAFKWDYSLGWYLDISLLRDPKLEDPVKICPDYCVQQNNTTRSPRGKKCSHPNPQSLCVLLHGKQKLSL